MGTLNNATTATQISEILAHLESGKGVCQSDAYKRFGCQRLASRIFDLKKKGYDVWFEWEHGENRHGRRVDYKRYYLAQHKPINSLPVEPQVSRAQKRFDAAIKLVGKYNPEFEKIKQALKIAAGIKP